MNNVGAKKPRRRYRLNGKKLAGTLLMLAFIAAVAVVVSSALNESDEVEVAAAGGGIPKNSESATSVTAVTNLMSPTAKQTEPESTSSTGALEGRLVVVDAGHGGFDPGAIGVSGSREDELNLAVAQDLKAALIDMGARVIMTREDEKAVADSKEADMAERRRIIVESGSDIVVSIHMNNFTKDPNVSGPLVLFMPGSEKGKALAEEIQSSMNTALEADGAARSDNLYVLKSGSQPCVLVECGYLSNENEERSLGQSDYQKKVAKAISNGIQSFFQEGK